MGTLDAKTAVVTGGSRGIGRAVVGRLVRDGATVVFSYRENEQAAAEVVSENGARAIAVRADQGDKDDVEHLLAEADRQLGGLDILVVNAAINPAKSILDTTEDDFDRVMAVNAKGPFFAIRAAATRLRDDGRIVAVSTLNTALPAPEVALYAASKAALEQFVAVAARELGERGITVNAISPGATDTDLLRGTNPPEAIDQAVAFTALGRLGQPDDIAAAVAFLTGPDARWVTGQNLRATGGFVL